MLAGLGSGVMVGVYPSLLSDELGAEQLSHTYPVSLTLAGLLNLAGPPALAQVNSYRFFADFAVLMTLLQSFM